MKIASPFRADLRGKLNYNQKIVATIESRQGELAVQFKHIIPFAVIAKAHLPSIEYLLPGETGVFVLQISAHPSHHLGSACLGFAFFYAFFADQNP